MIEAKNLSKKFESGEETLIAVNDVSFVVKTGEFVTITGRSGSGKSTLMYQLSLLDHPSAGRILIDGQDVTDLSEEVRTNIRLRSLGFIFQDYALIPELSALENVLIPLLMRGMLKPAAENQAKKSLERIGLGDRLSHLPSELSGGQQQRVSIARAIAHEPKIIFADEPTANLDSESADTVLKVFLNLNKEHGQTIVMVTHEPEYARLTHKIFKLVDGIIEG